MLARETSEGTSEVELIGRAARGDETAFLLVYERHRTPVFRFARRLLGSNALAEDVTQECFLSLMRKPQLFEPGRASLRSYLCGAARYIALRQLRLAARETGSELSEEPRIEPEGGEPLRRLLDEEAAEAVQRAIAGLPPLQREALLLFEYEGMSLGDIAVVTEVDVGVVKSRLHRGRENLRRLLAPLRVGHAGMQGARS
jgi:RNA polymerase sigma-70 factor, ECF subfamily